MDVAAGQTFIQAGEPCINMVIILSGKASGVEWPMHGHSYLFKDFDPGDFLGEIESFAGMRQYRVSVVTLTENGMLRLENGKIQVDQSGYLEMKEYIEQCIEGRS